MCVLYLISKYLQDIHILYGHYRIPHTQKHGYRHQNRDSSFASYGQICDFDGGHFECAIKRG